MKEASQRLQALKDQAKKAYRAKALELHPDKNGGDPKKTEKFKLISDFMRQLDGLRCVSRPKPQPKRIVVRLSIG